MEYQKIKKNIEEKQKVDGLKWQRNSTCFAADATKENAVTTDKRHLQN